MSIFYDPIKKKPHAWVMAVFIILPIILVIIAVVLLKGLYTKQAPERKAAQEDIFDKI